MRKPSKVVCITEGRRKLDQQLDRSILIRGEAIGTLRCERISNRIDFFLTPLFGTREEKGETCRGKTNLIVLPSPHDDTRRE